MYILEMNTEHNRQTWRNFYTSVSDIYDPGTYHEFAKLLDDELYEFDAKRIPAEYPGFITSVSMLEFANPEGAALFVLKYG